MDGVFPSILFKESKGHTVDRPGELAEHASPCQLVARDMPSARVVGLVLVPMQCHAYSLMA
eukprot:75305-Chlamydomonas_euryale.AAC.1